MIDGIQIEDGRYGLRAVVTSSWSENMTSYIQDLGVVELELNDGKGWNGESLGFLANFPHLKSLTIIDFNIASIDSIQFLHELRALEVTTYCNTEIRFSDFPYLEECILEWRSKATSLFECFTLKRLLVNRYDGKDVALFSKLVNLESLVILNAPIESLRGLSALKHLKSLRLGNLNRLVSLTGIEGLIELQELEVNTCRRIGSIEPVGFLKRLKKLYLNNDGPIASLDPLRSLNSLESILFYESTNVLDGDLSPLLQQKMLSRASFKNRRHYSHRREELAAALKG